MNKVLCFLFLLVIMFSGLQAVINYPFPQHTHYTNGVILPQINQDMMDQTVMDQAVESFYIDWKQAYLRNVPGAPNQTYVFYNEDVESEPDDAVSVSEGQGYGMMLAAYMAGFDPQAQTIFDNMFRYYLAFQSILTPSLMGWQQMDEDGEIVPTPPPYGGDDSATDGDIDIAYALLLADKQWGSTGAINYLAQANAMMDAIIAADVNLQKFTLKLGDWVEDGDKKYGKATRQSDFILNALRNFYASSNDPIWNTVITNTYSVINELFNNYAANTGLLPDFSEFKNNAYVPARANFLEDDTDGDYSWNSSRIPWRIATDYILSGEMGALTQLTTLNNWIQTSTNQNPQNIRAGYELDGTPLVNYDDLAFIAPFAVSAMISKNNQTWLNILWTFINQQPSANENYYANSIRLLCLIVVSGNWWTPMNVTP